jgi:uncharacterized protein YoaH (UPF0181 family)
VVITHTSRVSFFEQQRSASLAHTLPVNISAARRLDSLDEQLIAIERLQKLLRTEITNVAEAVRVAAAQLRRRDSSRSGRGRKKDASR